MNNIEKNNKNSNEILYEAALMAFSYPLTMEKIKEFKLNQKNKNIIKIYNYLLDKNNIKIYNEISINSGLNLIFSVQSCMNSVLRYFFENSTWVGPFRDVKGRFHRIQGLDVSEIWVDGRNLPMYLHRLDRNSELSEFSNWVYELIGYQVEIKNQPPNVEICMVRDGSQVNLIDTGYGVSQILPILAHIWLNTIGKRIKIGKEECIVTEKFPIMMEQPELHLHPTHQAQIADALANSLKFNSHFSTNAKPLFIVETHSETLIIKLSALIREKKLSPEDVQVVVFSKATNKTNTTEVTVSTFDEEGRLGNWPYGFFNYRS